MPAGHHPATTRTCQEIVVEFECQNRSPSAARLPMNEQTIFTPLKMLLPLLLARIEDAHAFAGFWIEVVGLSRFVAVT